ncbi:MAG TPA: RNA-binding transcriptional accessory protein [Candidatus Aphodocola excrementigallinarum]|uniref:RNA-binding transcriptional accessory protein n=1 Tax=Candidatus Aphodocola excrementigallinarum TaxID=2840670 RepID=A0A9D1IQD9_9FIRM|nr:RNA-binding transcriptional accessory protein [Candidatus Aphodocola excrementigallinarum]
MNEEIIKQIANELNITDNQVKVTLEMLEEKNTIPFIARYRKERTKGLTEEEIKVISDAYLYQVNLLKRKEDVIRLIEEKGLLTDELKNKIMLCTKLVEVEDLYRPYKEKKKTKATEAIKNGLEPLAKMIMSCPLKGDINDLARKFINDKVKDVKSAIEGAKYIIAEWISDNASYRKYIRNYMYKNGILIAKKKKDAKDDNKTYEMYYDYNEAVSKIKPHRILAINRAEKEDVINVKIDVNTDNIISYLEEKNIKNKDSFCADYIKEGVEDSFKRLIYPSVQREIRSDLTEKAMESAINNFSKNLEALLLTPPMKEKIVLAFDPGFVNGCKLAVIDKTGKYLDSIVIKPFVKNITEEQLKRCKMEVAALIQKYSVDIIAIGNGTASRESERFCAELIKEYNMPCKYVIVSEAGASIYSASKIGVEEFPDLAVEKRSAVSIGRRLQDPLSELVKVPPEGIGVGLYQHDVQGKKLSESLDFVVSKAVNSVGVNVNTASPSLLKYVSGLKKNNIDKIIDYRNKHGKINSRDEIKKAKLLSDKTYEQAIGFLRITEGDNILDETAIHPESYDVTLKLLNKLGFTLNDVGKDKLIESLNSIDKEKLINELNTDSYTLDDVIESLKKPNRDPRDEMPQPILKSDVLSIDDLKVGMKLQGTVRNVVDFGAFIDIGLHDDGLVHISKISKNYIKHPSDVLSVGDITNCYVIDVNKDKEKVSLSLIDPNE